MAKRPKMYNENNFQTIPQLQNFSKQDLHIIKVVSSILPFRVNQFVLEELINWDNIPNDPIYQLVFPQKEMLSQEDFTTVSELIRNNSDRATMKKVAYQIRKKLNPHPSNQVNNIPTVEDTAIQGIQHKYKETVLFFPSQGQTCFSYCTFCFRWAQFTGDQELKFASNDTKILCDYLASKPTITDVLFTGGDPMIMNTKLFESYFMPLLDSKLDHIKNIRIGTKFLSYWPHRITVADDADDLLRLFAKMIKSGKNIAIMSHINHWIELEPELTKQAIKRLQNIGVIIRSQSPILKHINNDPKIWSKLWKMQIHNNIIPYYMFVERDTGSKYYFQIPLYDAWSIYKDAISTVSGLGRTARGPSMSTSYGKIEVQGVTEINNEKLFILRFIQAKNPSFVQQPFFAKFDANAVWINDLRPAFGESKFFFTQN